MEGFELTWDIHLFSRLGNVNTLLLNQSSSVCTAVSSIFSLIYS